MSSESLMLAKKALTTHTIPTPYYTAGKAYIERLIETGVDNDAKLGILIGTSGVGKTHLCDKIRVMYPDIITDEKTTKPVIYVKLGASAAIGDVLSAIHTTLLGARSKGNMNKKDRSDHICELMQELGTKLIIVDEAQHAMAGVSNEYGKTGEYINTLKILIDDGKVPILVSGLEHLKKLRNFPGKNEDFGKQLKRRSHAPVELKPFGPKGTARVINIYRKQLKELGVICDVLSNDLVKARIHLCTGGAIGVIFDLLKSSLRTYKNCVSISQKSLEEEAELLFDEEENAFQFKDNHVKQLITKQVGEAV